MRLTTLLALVPMFCAASLAAPPEPPSPPPSSPMPKLERFSPDQADKTLDPCNDFFQYACNKWIQANPIPADQVAWGTFNALAVWNVAAVHNTLEEAAAGPKNTPVDQKVGDYYSSCMDEATINKAGLTPLKPVLDRIGAMKDKSALPEIVAQIHQTIRPANLNFIDAQYPGVLFGLYGQPDFDDARNVVIALDQSGICLLYTSDAADE